MMRECICRHVLVQSLCCFPMLLTVLIVTQCDMLQLVVAESTDTIWLKLGIGMLSMSGPRV